MLVQFLEIGETIVTFAEGGVEAQHGIFQLGGQHPFPLAGLQHAAQELASFLAQVTGAQFPVVKEAEYEAALAPALSGSVPGEGRAAPRGGDRPLTMTR